MTDIRKEAVDALSVRLRNFATDADGDVAVLPDARPDLHQASDTLRTFRAALDEAEARAEKAEAERDAAYAPTDTPRPKPKPAMDCWTDETGKLAGCRVKQ